MEADHARAAFETADRSARGAVEALLAEIESVIGTGLKPVAIVADHCRACPDAFQSLDLARLLRMLLTDLDGPIDAPDDVTRWAYAEVRVQVLTQRLTRVLREQGESRVEQAIVDLSVMHLSALEQGPHYAQIFAEMSRMLDDRVPVRPMSLVNEVLGESAEPAP